MPMIDPQFCAQGYCEIFKNHPKKFLILIINNPKVFHIKHCPSTYFTFSNQIRICCGLVCSNERSIASYSRAVMPCPTIAERNLISQKVVHKADCPSKYYTFGHQIQVCCALVCSNERSTASCSKSIMNSSKITQRKFDFPKVVNIQYCPSKYFTCSHLSQVCCALICSNK